MQRSSLRALVAMVLVLSGVFVVTACKSVQPGPEPTANTAPGFGDSKPAEKVEETGGFGQANTGEKSFEELPSGLADKLNAQGILKEVLFDFDSADLGGEAKTILNDNAAQIRQHAPLAVRIEGHCDERGTTEYNLALGDRRARAARDYIVSLGIPANRLRTISYGKERPVDPGHTEAAWAQNRRAEFVFIAE
jgi:peptidoglycan-associated lipoprotein